MNPFLAGILHDQRAQGEGEGHGEADIAQIEHGRVNHHLGILQQRVEAAAVRAKRAFQKTKRVGREIHQRQEEDLHCGQDHGGVGKEPGIGLVAQAQHESIGRQQQRPEQQRTFLAGPQGCKLIRSRQIAVAMVEDVGNAEVVGKRGKDEGEGGEQDRRERRHARAASGLAQALGGVIFLLAEQCDQSGQE